MTLCLAILGDSIAYGQGAARTEDTIGARLVTHLAEAGIETYVRVFAVPGARSDSLAIQVDGARAWGAQLAIIVVGANDLTHFVPPAHAAAQLSSAVRALRVAGVQVVVLPAPDLSAVPWVPPQFRELVQAGSAALRAAQAAAAIAGGACVADVDDVSAAFAADVALFSVDRFHPSSAGYALITKAIAPVVLDSARAALG
jgi:lysophospholipase L1-like esterase